MSAIENYWQAVQARAEERPEEPRDFDGSMRAPWPTRGSVGSGTADGGSGEPPSTASVELSMQPDFYCYRSIRFRKGPHDWGVYVMTGGRNLVANLFARYFSSDQDAKEAATDFLMACGTAHYRFDVYAMSVEAMLQKWLYIPYRFATRDVAAPRLESALVFHAAEDWAAPRGLSIPVAKILRRWTTDAALNNLPARALGAYAATVLIEGFGALPGNARYDQAEWARSIPEELENGCLGPHDIECPLLCSPLQQIAKELSPEDWLARWRVTDYTLVASDNYRIHQDLVIFGETFPNGKFPVPIEKVEGSFVCQETNMSSTENLPRDIDGNADLSRNREFASLTEIHHRMNRVAGGKLRISERLVKERVLGLFKIKTLFELEIEADEPSLPGNKWVGIVNQHLNGSRSIPECQQELIEAGLKNYAKL
jgi:hypothetical protein